MMKTDLRPLFAIAVTAAMGAVVAYLRIPSIVLTLGMMSVLQGGLISVTNGAWISNLPPGFQLGQMAPLGVPMPIWCMVLLTAAAGLWMRYSATGRAFYAVGGNAEAAVLSGISPRLTTVAVFAVHGLFVGVAGVLFATFAAPGGTCVAPQPSCALSIKDSSITGNASTLHTGLPAMVDGSLVGLSANGGGINIGPSVPTTITGTHIDDNLVSALAPNGEPVAIDAGMIVADSPLTMRKSTLDDNRTDALGATFGDIGVVGDALELDGPGSLDRVTVADNETTVTASQVAEAAGALAIFNYTNDPPQVTVTDSAIVHNRTTAVSPHGTAQARGGGVFNNSLLSFSHTLIAANQTDARAPSGVTQGGGIWNGVDISGPPVSLTLEHSAVTRNRAFGSPGVTASGGGLFTTSPVTLLASPIVFNQPDQCVGCSLSAAAQAPANVTAAGAARASARDADGSR